MAKPSRSGEQNTPPSDYPNMPPPAGVNADIGSWVLNAVSKAESTMGRVDGTLSGLQAQLNRMETKLDKVEHDVAGHGNWMHTLKVFAASLALVVGWVFANAVWPLLKSKFGIPSTTP